jgi:hypothetical protein
LWLAAAALIALLVAFQAGVSAWRRRGDAFIARADVPTLWHREPTFSPAWQ